MLSGRFRLFYDGALLLEIKLPLFTRIHHIRLKWRLLNQSALVQLMDQFSFLLSDILLNTCLSVDDGWDRTHLLHSMQTSDSHSIQIELLPPPPPLVSVSQSWENDRCPGPESWPPPWKTKQLVRTSGSERVSECVCVCVCDRWGGKQNRTEMY